MPTAWHDAVTKLITEHPRLGPAIAAWDRRFHLRTDIPATVGSPQFNDRKSRDFYADAVVVAGGNPADPEYGLIVEAQQAPVSAKLDAWPRYAAALWLDTGKPAIVLVLCPDDKTARWYAERQPVLTNLPSYAVPLVVIGPAQIPILNAEQMAADPALGVVSFAAHGRDHPSVVEAFHGELRTLPPARMQKYYEFAYNMSDLTLRNILEELVAIDLLLTSPIATENQAIGFAKGKVEGKAEGETESILLVLKARGLSPTEAERERIARCTDLKELQAWLTRAVTATSVSDLFG